MHGERRADVLGAGDGEQEKQNAMSCTRMHHHGKALALSCCLLSSWFTLTYNSYNLLVIPGSQKP